ncbi:MAG: type II toxin-antitoxin system RelE/ParE family toxin [Bryobacteraceae bacterium]
MRRCAGRRDWLGHARPRIPARYAHVVDIAKKKGQHSIRINDQWQICFIWREDAAERVEIVDYH